MNFCFFYLENYDFEGRWEESKSVQILLFIFDLLEK